MTNSPVKHQTYYLSRQMLESRDVEGSQDTIEVDDKGVAARFLQTSLVDDVVISRR